MKKPMFSLLLFTVLAGCSPVFYTPSSQNVPLLTHEKEMTMSAGIVAGESADGVGLNGAYAVAPHLGIMAGTNIYFPGEKSDSSSWGSGGLIEGGAGYFTNVSEKFVFDTYGLLSFGWMKNYFPKSIKNHPNTDGKINANLLGIAVQPSFGFKSRYFEAAFSTKAGLMNYMNVEGNLITRNSDQTEEGSQQDYLTAHKGNFMVEPAITLRGGWDFLKLELQVGESFNLSHAQFPQDNGWVSIRLFYRWNQE